MNGVPIGPPTWTREELEAGRRRAVEVFRRERLEEPIEEYGELFDEYQGHVEELLETSVDLSTLQGAALQILTSSDLFEAFRYLAGPPISEDDLKIVADVESLAPTRLRNSPDFRERVLDTVHQALDRRRFPWVAEDREPTEQERAAAVLASAALMASQRVETNRRSRGSKVQEGLVRQTLRDNGFQPIPKRTVNNMTDAPRPGEFFEKEDKVVGRRADVVVGLWDGRMMPIECKVSNSEVNSYKRLNNDAAVKAVAWSQDLGPANVVPAAVLSGVYKLENLEYAQNRGLALFWAHDLQQLVDWIERTRP